MCVYQLAPTGTSEHPQEWWVNLARINRHQLPYHANEHNLQNPNEPRVNEILLTTTTLPFVTQLNKRIR